MKQNFTDANKKSEIQGSFEMFGCVIFHVNLDSCCFKQNNIREDG